MVASIVDTSKSDLDGALPIEEDTTDEVKEQVEIETHQAETSQSCFLMLLISVGILLATLSFALFNNEEMNDFRRSVSITVAVSMNDNRLGKISLLTQPSPPR